jgi:integrase
MAAGWNPKYVQQRLGHSNISTTMGTYSHVTPEMMREAMKRYEDYMKH